MNEEGNLVLLHVLGVLTLVLFLQCPVTEGSDRNDAAKNTEMAMFYLRADGTERALTAERGEKADRVEMANRAGVAVKTEVTESLRRLRKLNEVTRSQTQPTRQPAQAGNHATQRPAKKVN